MSNWKSIDNWNAIDKILESCVSETKTPPQPPKKTKPKYDVQLDIVCTRTGAYIQSDLEHSILKKIRNYFSIKFKTMLGYIIKTECCYIKNDRLYVPRFGAFLLSNKFKNINITSNIECLNTIEIGNHLGNYTDIQLLIGREILQNWFTVEKYNIGQSGVYVNMQGGLGKTYLGMYMIHKLKCRTLIVTHNTTILNQWSKALRETFPDNSVGYYYGKKKVFGDFVIGIINSLVMDNIRGFDTPEEYFNNFDFVIFDEAHEFCCYRNRKIFKVCNAPYVLALSATPEEREDGLDKIMKWNVGKILVASELDGFNVAEEDFTGRVIQVRYRGPMAYTKTITSSIDMMSISGMLAQFMKDEQRSELIADLTMQYYERNFNIFIFADRRDYLTIINEKLKIRHLTSKYLTNEQELDSIRLVGGATAEEVEDAKNNKRIILTTYQYMGTGTSIPKMNCIILATPRKSKSGQTIRRIFRLGGDSTIERQIIDIVDWNTPLKNQWYVRKKYYTDSNFVIETMDYNAKEVLR